MTRGVFATPAGTGPLYAELVLKLAILADGHPLTVAGVLGIAPTSARERLRCRRTRDRWRRFRETRAPKENRARRLRHWWRCRLKAIGIDPATLPVDDPLWPACHRFPRGHLVRTVAAEMRAERPGETLATTERLTELLDRVAALAAAMNRHDAPK